MLWAKNDFALLELFVSKTHLFLLDRFLCIDLQGHYTTTNFLSPWSYWCSNFPPRKMHKKWKIFVKFEVCGVYNGIRFALTRTIFRNLLNKFLSYFFSKSMVKFLRYVSVILGHISLIFLAFLARKLDISTRHWYAEKCFLPKIVWIFKLFILNLLKNFGIIFGMGNPLKRPGENVYFAHRDSYFELSFALGEFVSFFRNSRQLLDHIVDFILVHRRIFLSYVFSLEIMQSLFYA